MSFHASIYIPRMSIRHDEDTVRNIIMADYRIGTISHIDFTPINKKPGFFENHDPRFKSAFIHFSDNTKYWDKNFWDKISRGEQYILNITSTEYWICLKNKNPIQRTMMNIHQVVENGRHLENLVQEQAKKIEELEKKLSGVNECLYQLLGGLFNQQDQAKILQLYSDVLDCKKSDKITEDDTSEWGIWPTTRQGDECEKRLEELETELKILKDDLSSYGVLEYNN
jgi:hypothetical protein